MFLLNYRKMSGSLGSRMKNADSVWTPANTWAFPQLPGVLLNFHKCSITWKLNTLSSLFTHRESRSSQELVQKCLCIPGSNWNLEMLVFEERWHPEYCRKTSRSWVESQQQTQPTYDAVSRNRTKDTLASALTTAPSLLPYREHREHVFYFFKKTLWGKRKTKSFLLW